MTISYSERINQQQCNHKCNYTRRKEIVQALPAYHFYNIVPVHANLMQSPILHTMVNGIRHSVQGQNRHADDKKDDPGINTQQADTGCSQDSIIIFLCPETDWLNETAVVSVGIIFRFITVKKILITVPESF